MRLAFLPPLLLNPWSAAAQDELAGLSPQARSAALVEQALSVATLGDWVFGCDNRAVCTVIGHADMADPNHVVADDTRSLALRLVFGPRGEVRQMDAIPDRQLSDRGVNGADWSGPFTLTIANLRGAPVQLSFARTRLSVSDTSAITTHLAAGGQLAGVDPASRALRLRLPWAGFAEVLAELARRRQGIAEWRRLWRPADGRAVPQPVREVIVSGVPAISAQQMDWCPTGIDAGNLRQFDLGNGQRLWQHDCPLDSGRNRWSRWFLASVGEGGVTPLHLPREPGLSTIAVGPGRGLPNAAFEWDFGVLRTFDRAWPGQEDCGARQDWGWTGREFVLLDRREMPLCQGLEAADWIVTWHRGEGET